LNLAGIAAPVFNGQGSVLGCIGVTMPAQRFRLCNSRALAGAVVAAAGQVSSALGFDSRAGHADGRVGRAASRAAARQP
jgi:DNA-binding IclR family transcriptional regulator